MASRGSIAPMNTRHCLLLFGIMFLIGCSAPSFLITPVQNTNVLEETEVQPGSGWFTGKIAIVEVEGVLANARVGGLLMPTENKLSLFKQQMEAAEADPSV